MIRKNPTEERPLRLEVGSAPHLRGGETYRQVTRTMLATALLVGAAGVALYGVPAARCLAISLMSAVVGEWVYVRLTHGYVTPSYTHAALIGLLAGLTLPVGSYEATGFHPTTWQVPLVTGLVGVVVGKGLMGGMGNYLWHPALVGRAAAELLYTDVVHPAKWVVLSPRHLFAWSVRPVPAEADIGWRASKPADAANALALDRPIEQLRQFAEGGVSAGAEHPLLVLIRDRLPPWEDTLLGGIGGGIGEPCSVLLIVCGVYLIYRGHLRWHMPVAAILAAALAAAILPVRTEAGAEMSWLPGFEVPDGLPAGVIYVMYHLTSGELLFGVFFFASDMVASPRTVRGQLLFGAGIGALTIAMRLYGPIPGACYWSILFMNTFIGALDLHTKRRVMGT